MTQQRSAEFDARLTAVAVAIESMLERLLGTTPLAGETERPQRLVAAMRHAALGGGKRLRPFLVVEAARLFGAEGDGVLRAAAAVEMVHCYSLVHDDLPSMDDDDMRRGRPTVHRAFDEATAILAGDALLTLAFDILADPATDADAAVRADLVLRLTRAAGLGGMVGGQILDLSAEGRWAPDGRPLVLDAAAIRRLQSMKTGALILVSLELGAILGRATAAARAALADHGRLIGLAFQIADDILDVEASAATTGKATGKDAGRGKATLVGLAGVAAMRAELAETVASAERALAPFGEKAATLIETARFIAFRDR